MEFVSWTSTIPHEMQQIPWNINLWMLNLDADSVSHSKIISTTKRLEYIFSKHSFSCLLSRFANLNNCGSCPRNVHIWCIWISARWPMLVLQRLVYTSTNLLRNVDIIMQHFFDVGITRKILTHFNIKILRSMRSQ